eukprot:5083790-Prymnesium_polylepis.1
MHASAPKAASGVHPRRPLSRRSEDDRAVQGPGLRPAAGGASSGDSAPERPGRCPWRPALHEGVRRSRAYTAVVAEGQSR